MKKIGFAALAITYLLSPSGSRARVSGNASFGQTGGRAAAEQQERRKPVIIKDDHPPSATSMFVEANVLMNVRADQYVAVYAVAHDGETPDACSRKMEATIKTFTDDVRALGIAGDDVFVDFVVQNKIYGFEMAGDIAKEKLVGFELKKNVLIHYTDRALLEKINAAAARSQIFDLVKVDYIYFNGLDADGFDEVISPVYNEPVVQCTLYLKVKYEVEQVKAR